MFHGGRSSDAAMLESHVRCYVTPGRAKGEAYRAGTLLKSIHIDVEGNDHEACMINTSFYKLNL